MSEPEPSKILNKKHQRTKSSRKSKAKSSMFNTKLIKKSLKLTKVKKKSNQKSLKFQPKSKNNEPIIEEADDNCIKKEAQYQQENSLGQLTQDFINYIKMTRKKSININDLVGQLSVKKRRIYDITNVLQGIGYLQKSGKNEIVWINPSKNQNLSKKKLFHQKNQKKNNDEQEIEEIENKINTNTEQLNSLKTNLELAKLRYLTIDDFKEYSIKNQNDLLIIKVNKDTSMNIIDQKDCKEAYHTVKQQINQKERDNNELLLDILNRKNQIYFESKNNDGLSFYFVRKGEIKETNSKEFNDNKNKANIFNKNKNIINTKHPLDNQKMFFPPNQQFNNNNYNNSYNNMINYYPNGNKNTFMNNNYNKFKRIEPNKIIINNNLTIQRIYPLDNSEKQK